MSFCEVVLALQAYLPMAMHQVALMLGDFLLAIAFVVTGRIVVAATSQDILKKGVRVLDMRVKTSPSL